MAAALSTCAVFAPRIIDAEELPAELSVRVHEPCNIGRSVKSLRRRLEWWTDGM
jgi:hypothetical protein